MSRNDLTPAASTPVSTSNFSVGPGAENGFVERRRRASNASERQGERRQFGSSHTGLSDDGRELAAAIDQYKVQHHRRYLTCDEMLSVLHNLGYRKDEKIT